MENAAQIVPEEILARWVAAGRPYRQRGRQFFTTVIVIAALLGILLLVAGEWMLIIVMGALVFFYWAQSKIAPEEVEYVISSRGIKIAGQKNAWDRLVRWWMDEQWGQKIAVVETAEGFPKRLFMVLGGGVQEEEVKTALGKYLPEDKPAETVLDRMGRWLGEKFPLEK